MTFSLLPALEGVILATSSVVSDEDVVRQSEEISVLENDKIFYNFYCSGLSATRQPFNITQRLSKTKITFHQIYAFRLQWINIWLKHYGNITTGVVPFLNFERVNRLYRHRSKKTSLAFGRESTGDRWFPSQRASGVENVSFWWRHHVI